MKASELRIGNKILRKDSDGQLIEDEITGIFHELSEDVVKEFAVFIQASNHLDYLIEDINPIPLTNEWLVKLGFISSNLIGFKGGWQFRENDKYYIQEMANAITIHLITEDSIALLTGFHYVHQLQNIWSTLNDEELTIN